MKAGRRRNGASDDASLPALDTKASLHPSRSTATKGFELWSWRHARDRKERPDPSRRASRDLHGASVPQIGSWLPKMGLVPFSRSNPKLGLVQIYAFH